MFLQNLRYGKNKNQNFYNNQITVDLKFIKIEKLIKIKKQKQLKEENLMIFLERLKILKSY